MGNMSDELSLRYREKILIHLKDYTGFTDDDILPEDMTQEGLADALGMSRTHASRLLKDLVSEGLLIEKKSHIRGRDRKLKTYRLSQDGVKKAEEVLSELGDHQITVVDGDDEFSISVTEIEERTGGKIDLITAISRLDSDRDKIDLQRWGPTQPVRWVDEAPETGELVGREEELDSLEEWLEGDTPVAVLYGRKGSGTSILGSHFIDTLEDRHVCWINVNESGFDDVRDRLISFLKELREEGEDGDREEMMNELLNTRALLIFDDYYEVSDEIVDFLTEMVDRIHSSPLKVLSVCRVGTPMYERFYSIEDVECGEIEEIKVPPLEKDEAESLLGNNIEDDALERIMLLTQGSPQVLKLLREGKTEKIEEISTLEKDQISLLMFLKKRTED